MAATAAANETDRAEATTTLKIPMMKQAKTVEFPSQPKPDCPWESLGSLSSRSSPGGVRRPGCVVEQAYFR